MHTSLLHRNRLRLIGTLFAIAFLCVGAQLYRIQICLGERLSASAEKCHSRLKEIEPERGYIYDREGRLLVSNRRLDTIKIDLDLMEEHHTRADAARILGPILGMSEQDTLARMDSSGGRRGKRIKRLVDAATVQAVLATGIAGLHTESEWSREQIYGTLASQVLGTVDSSNTGIEGIELLEDQRLRGQTVYEKFWRLGVRRVILERDYTRYIPTRGVDVVLTLDRYIQEEAEAALSETCAVKQAEFGMLVALDPANGEVLAMASYPPFDPRQSYPTMDDRFRCANNHAVDIRYEPGSTMKPFTVALGLEVGAVTPEKQIYCERGSWKYMTRMKSLTDLHGGAGWLTVTDVIIKSNNIGTAKIADMVIGWDSKQPFTRETYHPDHARLADGYRKFGFSQPTGIGLPGEIFGNLDNPSQWHRSRLLNMAFGQGIEATAIGMARAYAVLANGGRLVTPHLVRGYRTGTLAIENGVYGCEREWESARGPTPQQVISSETARQMRTMMQGVVHAPHGTGKRARVDGYTAAGKTGTSQLTEKNPETGKVEYVRNRSVLSFTGFVPASDPRVVIVVVVYDPRAPGRHFGGTVAAPIFKRVAACAMRRLNVPYDDPETIPLLSDSRSRKTRR